MDSTQQGRKGNLIVISAPSGAGKTTLCRALLAHYPDIAYSISTTTRSPRKGEKDGVDYHFMDEARFREKLEQHCWAEWALVHGYYYGTSASFLEQTVASGRDVLLDIDVQGARQICERYPEAITIFIMPPSLAALRERLETRGTDSRETIDKRMHNAAAEMSNRDFYRHVIVNDRLRDAEEELIAVVGSYRAGEAAASRQSRGEPHEDH